MDFALDEQQEAVRGLAERIFQDQVTVDRLKEVEQSTHRFDRELWSALAQANLLGLCLPDDVGGSGLGPIELCLLLEQQGRVVAPVPLLPTVASAMTIAELGTDAQRQVWLPGVVSGDVVLTAALDEPHGAPTVERSGALHGTKLSVPAAGVAARVLVAAGDRLFLVDPAGDGVERQPVETTNREVQAHLVLDGAPGEALGGPGAVDWLRPRLLVGLCALQVGVAEAALRLAAEYTSGRHQFGRPLSTFQGVALRAADAYIDTEAMRVTMWQAAWRLATGRDATREVLVAKWWAADAGERIVHATQHLHGGMGADIDYPVHRYFLWGKQLADTLGGAGHQLAELGQALA